MSPGKCTFSSKGAKNVPIKGVDNKRQTTVTFTVNSTERFLPMQLILLAKLSADYLNIIFQPPFLLASPKIIGPIRNDPPHFLKKLSFFISKK